MITPTAFMTPTHFQTTVVPCRVVLPFRQTSTAKKHLIFISVPYSGQGKSKRKEKSKQSAKCKVQRCNGYVKLQFADIAGMKFLCQHETFGLCPLKGSKNLHSPGWMAAPRPPVHNQTGCTGKVGSEIWIWWGAVIWIWFKLDFWWHGPIRYHYHRLLEKISRRIGRLKMRPFLVFCVMPFEVDTSCSVDHNCQATTLHPLLRFIFIFSWYVTVGSWNVV